MGECRELQKMKNSGNEAKKYLKTKDITFLNAANYARFACKLAQIGRLKGAKTAQFAKTKSGLIRASYSRLHRVRVGPVS